MRIIFILVFNAQYNTRILNLLKKKSFAISIDLMINRIGGYKPFLPIVLWKVFLGSFLGSFAVELET